MTRRGKTSLSAVAGMLLAVAASGQRPAPSVRESVGVSLVQVPVTVLDSSGAPVRGLQLSDFRLFDDGEEIHPGSLDVTEYPSAAPGGSSTAAAPAEIKPAALRRFLLLFDLSYITLAEFSRARAAAERFVGEQLGDQDIVCVGSLSVNGTSFMKGFTRDRAELEKGLGELRLPADLPKPTTTISDEATEGGGKFETFTAGEVDWLRRPGRALDAKRMEQLIQALQRLATAFKKVDGRKQIIFFSHGFDMMVDDSSVLKSLEAALDALRRSDCVLNAVDIAGLREGRADVDSRWGNSPQEVLYAMASETSGQFVANSNDFTGQLNRVLDATRVVYLLSFPARPAGHPGSYHRLEVKVSRTGVRVFARPGYEEPN